MIAAGGLVRTQDPSVIPFIIKACEKGPKRKAAAMATWLPYFVGNEQAERAAAKYLSDDFFKYAMAVARERGVQDIFGW
jgi:hypothetical protein